MNIGRKCGDEGNLPGLRRIVRRESKAAFCILDCCFSGAAPAKVLEDSPIHRDPGTPFEVLVGEGRILFAASGTEQVAYELPRVRHKFRCRACNKEFSKILTLSEHEKGGIVCPHCKSKDVEQRWAAFYAVSSKKS